MFRCGCGYRAIHIRHSMKQRWFICVVAVTATVAISSMYWTNSGTSSGLSLRMLQSRLQNPCSSEPLAPLIRSGTNQGGNLSETEKLVGRWAGDVNENEMGNYLKMSGCKMDGGLPVASDGRAMQQDEVVADVILKERLPVVRDVRAHEPWPEVQRDSRIPGNQAFETVHWLWCGKKTLEFRHYLSVLSAVRILQPRRLVMHFTDMPKTDAYNAWFNELTDALPNLEFEKLTISVSCNSTDTLRAALGILAQDGGVFIGENTILTRFPKLAEELPCWFAVSAHAPRSASNGIVIARQALDASTKEACFHSIVSSRINCVTVQSYNTPPQTDSLGTECIFINTAILPRDIMQADSPFGELARWLFYGRRSLVTIQAEGAPIPRIAHFIRIRTNKRQYVDEMSFGHFMSVLTALHVAGFRHVYVHADVEPKGRWWEELRKENVTFVPLVSVNTVYQHPVTVTAHVSDLIRYLVLYKYGGAYQDWDVFWTQHLPDSLLANPAVIGFDWQRRGWPDNINNGIMMARARSHFLHHFLATHRVFRDRNWAYNSLMMSYRTWELYPQTAFLDRHLQVLCHFGRCHPTWLPGYVYGGSDKQPLSLINETLAVHVTIPKPPTSLSSLAALRKGQDVYAAMGRMCLVKSGRGRWLEALYTDSDLKL